MFQDKNGRWHNDDGSFGYDPFNGKNRNDLLSGNILKHRSLLFHLMFTPLILTAMIYLWIYFFPQKIILKLLDLNSRVTHSTNVFFSHIATVILFSMFYIFAPENELTTSNKKAITFVTTVPSSSTSASVSASTTYKPLKRQFRIIAK